MPFRIKAPLRRYYR